MLENLLELPKVSIIITSYNYEKYITKTLESVFHQSYKNIEIIIVDDCSSDGSVNLIRELINDKPNVKFICHEKNQGQFAAYLTGLSVADGQFISFIDSDDIIHPKYVETLVRIHLACAVSLVSAQIFEIGENDEIHSMYSPSSFQKSNSFEAKTFETLNDVDVEAVEYRVLEHVMFGGWHWCPSSANMYRKSAIQILLSYSDVNDWRICPDKFVCNFAHLIGGSAQVFAPLVGYRRHKSNAGNTNLLIGNKRYNTDKSSQLNLKNNLSIRPSTLKFIFNNRKLFNEKFGTVNTYKLFFRILISYFQFFNQVKRFFFK